MIDLDLLAYLSQFVTEDRLAKMHRVLDERTRYFTVLVEDIYQPHNASAVLRTCDSVGVQDVHIVENRNSYQINPGVELGTAQWLTLHRYRGEENNTPAAIHALREGGYRIVATTPHTNQVSLQDFEVSDGPAALLFGNEPDGLSSTALELADAHLVIPMVGFVESLNISVSAALVMFNLLTRLRQSGIDYHLSPAERNELLLAWLRSSIARSQALEREYYDRKGAR
jgi:tRNA (guanosine-2'-O-)-methyltransferase